MYPFRVFISYTQEDVGIIRRIDAVLREQGLIPVWDDQLPPGTVFTDAIKLQIATAHLFIAVLTPHSQRKPWILQETGFAIGIDVTVLPVTLNSVPSEMIAGIQAVRVQEDLSDLEERLREVDIEWLIFSPEAELQRLNVSHRVAEPPEKRTELLVSYAEAVRKPAHVRQRARFSSFALPLADVRDPVWTAIDGGERRSEYYRHLLRRERQVLERHARGSGCTIILALPEDPPNGPDGGHPLLLAELLAFLQSMPNDALTVGISKRGIEGNLTLVGDWFGAKAVPPQIDYRHTLFSRHAPTVLRWVREFDEELGQVLALQGTTRSESREVAMAWIQSKLLQNSRSI